MNKSVNLWIYCRRSLLIYEGFLKVRSNLPKAYNYMKLMVVMETAIMTSFTIHFIPKISLTAHFSDHFVLQFRHFLHIAY